jgi:chemotaxis protein histidine kinase CheA
MSDPKTPPPGESDRPTDAPTPDRAVEEAVEEVSDKVAEAAPHEAVEQPSEKVDEAPAEAAAAEKDTEKAPEKAPEKAAEKAPEKAPEKAAEKAAEKKDTEKAPEPVAEKAPEPVAEKVAETVPPTAGSAPPPAAAEAEEKPAGSTGAETPAVADEKPVKARRNPWLTVGTIIAVLLVLAGFGYFAGLGPMSRLSTMREIKPPEKLGGLSRITDEEIRKSLALDSSRDQLRRANEGKSVAVEAYGDPAGDRIYTVIALRGKIELEKMLKEEGTPPEQVKTFGEASCVPAAENLLTRCYRTSNTLTIIAQDATSKLNVDAVGPIANEAFDAMK